MADLEIQYAAEKRMMVNEAINKLNAQYDPVYREMKLRHDKELADLQVQSHFNSMTGIYLELSVFCCDVTLKNATFSFIFLMRYMFFIYTCINRRAIFLLNFKIVGLFFDRFFFSCFAINKLLS